MEDLVLFYMNLLGTVAFSISGAVVGIRLGMDLFGVVILGCCTAVGGGMLRDVILLRLPATLQTHLYIGVASVTALLVFALMYVYKDQVLSLKGRGRGLYDFALLFSDSIGLAAFTVVGVSVTRQAGYGDNTMLLVFMGCLTAAGGGLLRDTMAGVKPYIFTKHIYALASILGGIVYVYMSRLGFDIAAMLLSSLFILALRLLAAHYHWNLPRV